MFLYLPRLTTTVRSRVSTTIGKPQYYRFNKQQDNKEQKSIRDMAKSKPRVIKNYEKLDEKLREAIAKRYPDGYASEIRTFDIGAGRLMKALPFETDDFDYLIKFPVAEVIEEDPADVLGGDDDLHLEGGEDVDEEEEQDEVEKPTDNLDDVVDDTESEPEPEV